MRCSQCGMKECCGADAGVGLSKLIKLERRVIYTGKDSSGFEVIRVHPDLMYIIQDAFGAHYQDPPEESGEDE